MAYRYYAVKKGKTPGIYTSWRDCKANVHHFPGAIFKGFNSKKEADAFMGGKTPIMSKKNANKQNNNTQNNNDNKTKAYAFVDGSFNIKTDVYGYGGFVFDGKERHIVQGNGSDYEMASMRNVAGEVFGSMAAIQKAIDLGLKEITIYYDYLGIEMWATGKWKRNKKGTKAYYEYFQSCKDEIEVHFKKVKAHTGVEGNEMADRLAKQSVGI